MPILQISLPVLLKKTFDYLPPQDIDCANLLPGTRVLVPFGKRRLVGFLVAVVEQSSVPEAKLKRALTLLETKPILSPDIMRLCCWSAAYYHYPLGMVFNTAVPSQITKAKSFANVPDPQLFINQGEVLTPWKLNAQQQLIASAVLSSLDKFQVITIDGVTGSGKTEVYLHIIQGIIANNQQALVLVPEISLTPQTINYFRQRFQVPIIPWHSRLSTKERVLAWNVAQLGLPSVLIGTRSAIFTPLPKIGVVIIDEEHDMSFKQQDSFRYNARDLAIWRARDLKIPVILGSATPSLETLYRSLKGFYQYFTLEQRAGDSHPPNFNLIDVKRQALEGGLSMVLIQQLHRHLAMGNQVLLFLNRRGFAPVLMCHSCGWIAECQYCDARLTYHMKPIRLHCHHCEAQQVIPQNCLQCRGSDLCMLGTGTERVELSLEQHFPTYSMVRLDRDTTKGKDKITQILDGIKSGQFQIIVGTQMIAKGHHFPNVTMVGIIDADYGLFSADFRASERLGQLITQVAGRAGRDKKAGEVWIQTHYPEHRLLQLLLHGSYHQFAQELLKERELAVLPPFAALAIFHASGKNLPIVEKFLLQVKSLALKLGFSVKVLGPVAAPMPRRAAQYRWQLLFQAQHKPILQQFLTKLTHKLETLPGHSAVRWSIDVDPIDMM